MKWRLIIDRGRDPYWNMALDEALLVMRENNRIPNTIRLYYFSPSSITIGYFQEASEVVNLDYVVKNNILFTRRITGGGAVFHDENGEVTYSVTALLEDFPSDIIERYRVICNGLIYAINSFGLKAIFKPVNDILVNGKKISGSAQTKRKNAFLQHGTLMYNTDLDKLSNSLKPLREKLLSHGINSIRERVTNLSIELNRRVTRDEVIDALVKGFSKALNTDFIISSFTKEEVKLASILIEKYRSHEWIYRK